MYVPCFARKNGTRFLNVVEERDDVIELLPNELIDRLRVRIPTMPITHSDLMAITIPSDADHRRSEATLGCSYHAEVIGIRQSLCA